MVYAEFQAKKHVDVSGPEGMKKATNRDTVNVQLGIMSLIKPVEIMTSKDLEKL